MKNAHLTIEELAVKHVLSHPRDKSNRYLAKMNRRFGIRATNLAVIQAKELLRIMDPKATTRRESPWGRDPYSPKELTTQRSKLKGRSASMTILDDVYHTTPSWSDPTDAHSIYGWEETAKIRRSYELLYGWPDTTETSSK